MSTNPVQNILLCVLCIIIIGIMLGPIFIEHKPEIFKIGTEVTIKNSNQNGIITNIDSKTAIVRIKYDNGHYDSIKFLKSELSLDEKSK